LSLIRAINYGKSGNNSCPNPYVLFIRSCFVCIDLNGFRKLHEIVVLSMFVKYCESKGVSLVVKMILIYKDSVKDIVRHYGHVVYMTR